MKRTFLLFVVLFAALSACARSQPTSVIASPSVEIPPQVLATSANTSAPFAATSVTLDDNGKTIDLRVGDSFLLDLGADMYEWSVEIDNQSVVARRAGTTPMIFDAIGLGTANLIAVGNPRCAKSTPPCMAPSIEFSVTIFVE
ncbi:MAG: hypothetical protein PHQ36_02675 [Anaerolineales bacterium]|nr:hypothetical protein [Anaerolineales bacterium]